MQLSKNFSLAELTKSQTAERMGLDNNPSEGEVENLRLLCERVLQPVRDHFNKVVTISSGYRNEILSQKIGSSSKSQHCKGMAADFEIFSVHASTGSKLSPETIATRITVVVIKRPNTLCPKYLSQVYMATQVQASFVVGIKHHCTKLPLVHGVFSALF